MDGQVRERTEAGNEKSKTSISKESSSIGKVYNELDK
jgi:hypothetical protein